MNRVQRMMAVAALAAAAATQAENVVNGAGASFPAPVYQNWTYSFSQATPDVLVNYQSIGSGAGINQIKAGTVDFAGTDSPLSSDELVKAELLQFPMVTGGVVVIVNVPGVKDGELALDGETVGDIFLGKITAWDDAKIQALNPGLKLPRMKINVVRRADSSGTTFIFTDYLCQVSPVWKAEVGSGSEVKWPVGIGGQKNPGVCNNVAKMRGAIGYTEYTYAKQAKLTMVKLRNKDGNFVSPAPETFEAASTGADWASAPGFQMMLTMQPGETSWPIVGVTYLLVPAKVADAARGNALKQYINWCFTGGAPAAAELDYVPMPSSVVELIRSYLDKNWQIAK